MSPRRARKGPVREGTPFRMQEPTLLLGPITVDSGPGVSGHSATGSLIIHRAPPRRVERGGVSLGDRIGVKEPIGLMEIPVKYHDGARIVNVAVRRTQPGLFGRIRHTGWKALGKGGPDSRVYMKIETVGGKTVKKTPPLADLHGPKRFEHEELEIATDELMSELREAGLSPEENRIARELLGKRVNKEWLRFQRYQRKRMNGA